MAIDWYKEIEFIPAKKFFSEPPPPLRWTVHHLIEEGTFVILGGEPKTSKTWAMLEIGLAVSSGTKAFGEDGFKTEEPKPVFMFFLEDGRFNIQARLRALGAPRGMNRGDLMELPIYIRCREPLDIESEADEIIDAVKGVIKGIDDRKGLIIIDPLRNAHTREENDSSAMRKVMDAVIKIRDSTGYSVLLSHHSRKSAKGQEDAPGHALRGSSQVWGAIDGLIGMRKVDSDAPNVWRTNINTQVKAGPQAAPFGLTLEVFDGFDGRAENTQWEVGGTHDGT